MPVAVSLWARRLGATALVTTAAQVRGDFGLDSLLEQYLRALANDVHERHAAETELFRLSWRLVGF